LFPTLWSVIRHCGGSASSASPTMRSPAAPARAEPSSVAERRWPFVPLHA